MAAYVVVDVTGMKDPAGLAQYREQVVPLVERFGGKYLAATDQIEALEGDWRPGVMVLIQFDNMERLREFWDCAEYQPLKPLRQGSIDSNIIAVNGVVMD